MNTSAVELALTARPALYGVIFAVFANNPSPDTLDQLSGPELQAVAYALLGERATPLLDALANVAQQVRAEESQGIDDLTSAYARLFIGPGMPEASPWESLYRGKEATLFCQTTLDVRKCYVREGLIPQSYPHVADDHVALEVDFVRRLGERARDAWLTNDRARAAKAIAASSAFLDNHLGIWVGAWADTLDRAPHGRLYRETARLLDAWVACDRQLLAELALVPEILNL